MIQFTNMFDYLPIASTIDGKIFCTHGSWQDVVGSAPLLIRS